tara:strand:+ start:308 stop:472 length:165 start_codon:yes stop_codon:yes gene_type:complete
MSVALPPVRLADRRAAKRRLDDTSSRSAFCLWRSISGSTSGGGGGFGLEKIPLI